MSIMRIWTVLFLLIAVAAVPAHAQDWQPFGPVDIEPDYQWFAPVDLGEYGEEALAPEGFFFEYERLNWNLSRSPGAPVGSETAFIQSLPVTDGGFGSPPRPVIDNSIDKAVPEANFAWGNRIEFGYLVDDNGWFVGIVRDLHLEETRIYGELDLNPETVPTHIGSLYVNFDPTDLLLGWYDFDGDGTQDDVDGDGVFGQDGADTTGDGAPDTIAPDDFDDLVHLPVFFEQVTITNYFKSSSVELMRSHRFEPFHYSKSVLELYYGARYFKLDDRFHFLGEGGFPFADTEFQTRAENNLIGPQIGGRWVSRRGAWKLDIEGRFLAAFNIQNLQHDGTIGTLLETAMPNMPLYQTPNTFQHRRTDVDWCPAAELRLGTSYQVTKTFAFTAGYTAMYLDAIARAADYTRYSLPDMGLRADHDPRWVFAQGFTFGVEFNH